MNTIPTLDDLKLAARMLRRRTHDREAELAELTDAAEESGDIRALDEARSAALDAVLDDLWSLIEQVEAATAVGDGVAAAAPAASSALVAERASVTESALVAEPVPGAATGRDAVEPGDIDALIHALLPGKESSAMTHRLARVGGPEHRDAVWASGRQLVIALGAVDADANNALLGSSAGEIGMALSHLASHPDGETTVTTVSVVQNDPHTVEITRGAVADLVGHASGERVVFADGTYIYLADIVALRLEGVQGP